MITSIFSKSKPINYIIVMVVLVIAFALHFFYEVKDGNYTIISFIALSIGLFYVFITDFVISKNDLTKRNSYGIMLLALFFVIFPEVFGNINIMVANLLVLFALRRLFSLHTKRDLTKKFFDAVFWIALSALFYTWAVLYLFVVFIALGYYWQNEGKYIAVSLFGVVTVFILLVLYNIVFKDQYLSQTNFDFSYGFDFSDYNSLSEIIKLTVVVALYLWSLIFYLKNTSEKSKTLKPIHTLIILASFIAIIIAVLAPVKNGNEIVFFMLPFSIIVANYIETVDKLWFKEMLVVLLILAPIINLLL
ncbi:DUF6427 family protein [uncultured Winogradskyella sp.]|jgi:hypothetical protein|uniref:DUF6427 family protein n=1 Tax=uncultured Winogradskyella sp. TaxID=395353 RepID=UPI0025CF0200|nr:DUF6427 family protein [uncultured Winogradskyella sp.]